MKGKFLLFISLLAFGLNLPKASAQASVLHLKIHNNEPFTLIMDDIRFKDIRPSFTIRNVPPGTHLLKVVQPRQNRRGKIIFMDYVRIPEGREIFAYIDSYGRFKVHEAVPIEYRPTQNPDDPYANNVQPPQSRPRPDSMPDENPRPNNNTQTPQPALGMPESEFMQLRNSVKNQDYDDTRLSVAKQAITNNKLNCDQLAQLLDVMSFETSKLELAKFAYPYLTDKEQLNTIYNRFKFNSSIDELSKLGTGGGR